MFVSRQWDCHYTLGMPPYSYRVIGIFLGQSLTCLQQKTYKEQIKYINLSSCIL